MTGSAEQDDILKLVTFQKDVTVFEIGEPADTAYIVKKGLVEIMRPDAGGALKQIGTARAGELFGKTALLAPGPYRAMARTLKNTECVAIRRPALDIVLAQSDPFIRALIHILASNMESMFDRLISPELIDEEKNLAKSQLSQGNKEIPQQQFAIPARPVDEDDFFDL